MDERQEAKSDASSALPQNSGEPGAAPPPAEPVKHAADKPLPMVEAPKIDVSDVVIPPAVEAFAEMSRASAREKVSAPAAAVPVAAPPPPSRLALLAAGIALVAALGSFAGSLAASGFAQLWAPVAVKPGLAEAGAPPAMKSELAELSALKASLDAASRSANGQLGRIVDRLDRVERAGGESTKLAHIADAVDRLEKKSAATAAALEATGALGTSEAARIDPKINDRILEGWIVQDVRGGRAVVENRYGGIFVVVAGNSLPGLGRVEAIKREDGQWVVVTARGLISSGQ